MATNKFTIRKTDDTNREDPPTPVGDLYNRIAQLESRIAALEARLIAIPPPSPNPPYNPWAPWAPYPPYYPPIVYSDHTGGKNE